MRIPAQWPATFEFACHSSACAPPPAGTGGSTPRGNPRLAALIKAQNERRAAEAGATATPDPEEAHLAKIAARRAATTAKLLNPEPAPAPAPAPAAKQAQAVEHMVHGGRYKLNEQLMADWPGTFIEVASPATFSGHKAHIYATNAAESMAVINRLGNSIAERGWGAKVAADKFHKLTEDPKYAHQRGKGVTVYFPNRATYKADLDHLVGLMADLPAAQRQGRIKGDTQVGNGVGTRYELRADAPQRDLDPVEYHHWYQSA